MTDSSTAVESTTTYQYDGDGRISKVQNTTKDAASDFNQTEVHQWIYNTAGKPEKMWRIINTTDSLEIPKNQLLLRPVDRTLYRI